MTTGRPVEWWKPSRPEAGPVPNTIPEETEAMDYPPDKPIFAGPLTLADSDPTDASTCSTPPKKKFIPAKIRSLISRLGLRYEPSSKSDLDAHAARVALLAEDMAETDPWKLEQAIGRHVSRSPYLPKASDLNEIIADITRPQTNADYVDVVGLRNNDLQAKGSDLRWAWNNPQDRGAGTHLYSLRELENKLAVHP